MKKLLIVGLVLCSASTYAAKLGMAGCGLGNVLLGEKEGWTQVFAATLNGTSGNQTFGISSGTSNCGPGLFGNKTAFIEANKANLANDISRGQGETLSSLATMYGCQDKQIGKVLQQNYKSIFPSAQTSAQEIDKQISSYMNSCKIQG